MIRIVERVSVSVCGIFYHPLEGKTGKISPLINWTFFCLFSLFSFSGTLNINIRTRQQLMNNIMKRQHGQLSAHPICMVI